MSTVPRVMIFPITMTCNSRCRSCGIWKLPESDKGHAPDALLDRVVDDPFLRKHVHSINISGGEPLVHPKLIPFLERLVGAYGSLREICINTDGHLLDRLEDVVQTVGPSCAEEGMKLRIYVSLDGIGLAHDRHRRHIGAFEQADRALTRLSELVDDWESLRATASFTVTDRNIDQVLPVFQYVKELGLRVDFNLAARPEVFIGGGGLQRVYQVLPEQTKELRLAMRQVCAEPQYLNFSNAYYATMLATVESGRRQRGCFFPTKGFVLMPDSKVYICGTFRDFYFGSLNGQGFEALWSGHLRSSCLGSQIPGKCETCFSNSYEDWDVIEGARV